MRFLEFIREHVLVLDGAMGTQIQNLDLTDADFGGAAFRMLSDMLVFSRPEAQKDIHIAYYRAGAHAVETNTFGASPMRMAEYDFSELELATFDPIPYDIELNALSYDEMAYFLNKRAAEIACEARDEYRQSPDYDGRPLYVIGSIGPSNRVLSSTDATLAPSTFDAIMDNFRHQVRGLVDGGADVLLYETQQDILETKAAVMGGLEAMKAAGKRLPIMCQVTVDTFGKMQIFNTDIHAALTTMKGIGVDTFGINCSIGPDLMGKTVEKLGRYSPLPISVVPNAGLPVSEGGRTVFKFKPDKLAEFLKAFVVEHGVSIVGGCCGTTPEHIHAIAEAVKDLKPRSRTLDPMIYISGPQEAVALDSRDSLIMIGERLNVRGSQKVRAAVENESGKIDHDALEEVVTEQVRDLGLKVIDVCMDSNLVDTIQTLKSVVHKQTTHFSGAMSIDSFDVEALKEAIKMYPGRPIINSISVEEVEPGKTKADAVLEATAHHDAVYIGLCAGPKGPGATTDEKTALAKLLVENAARHGVTPDRLLIDMNVFPLGSESDETMNFAMESINAIPRIKAIHPDLKTVCGVGNLTNGLANKPYMRKVLTSVWLDEARKAGLDAAIVNPNHYVFVKDLDRHDYELGLKAVLNRDLDAFAELEDIAERKKGVTVERRSNYDDLALEEAICEKIKDGYKERANGTVEVDGYSFPYQDRIVLQAVEAVKTHDPLEFINSHLMGAMNELGDGFAKGDVSLPHLLKSADVMKQVMGFLESYMKQKSGVDMHSKIEYKGTIVLGTVYQDVHSIGKDLAKTLFENYGYRVIDLGVMTPLQSYLDTAKENNADAIGLSALLVQTSNHMITVSKMMREQDLEHLPVLIGGAPVNHRHAAFVAMAGGEDEEAIRSNVFYCPTAMDGVNIMNGLLGNRNPDEIYAKNREKLVINLERAQKKSAEDERLLKELPRREVSFEAHRVPDAPWFQREVISMTIRELAPHLDKKTLFALNWKFGGSAARKRQGESAEKLDKLLEAWIEKCDSHGWIKPMGLCGVFPCQADGDEVIVYDIEDPGKELCRFTFTLVIGADRKDTVCASQYFWPKDSGRYDAIGLQLSTSGPQVDGQLKKFREAGDSESCLFLQGMSDRVAEDLADRVHAKLREIMGYGPKHGVRWSPGYPALADAQHNKDILMLLKAAEMGVRITEAGEFSPTGTTAAVVSFHPDARYT